MRIAIIGYGKMGRMIESIARERGHEIGSCIDVDTRDLLSADNLAKHDAAIEFTTPGTAYENISMCLDAGLPVVSGTTGWTERLGELANRCRKENGTFLYASNFSLGVNLLFHLNAHLAAIMNKYGHYDVSIREAHHKQKLDAPSGTALSLAEDILKALDRKTHWALLDNNNRKPGDHKAKSGIPSEKGTPAEAGTSAETQLGTSDVLSIEAIREGSAAGIHEINWESEFDTISLRHSAKDRRGFAGGAVMAADYIHDKKGFFTMKDILEL